VGEHIPDRDCRVEHGVVLRRQVRGGSSAFVGEIASCPLSEVLRRWKGPVVVNDAE
jgi:hypothetical protein